MHFHASPTPDLLWPRRPPSPLTGIPRPPGRGPQTGLPRPPPAPTLARPPLLQEGSHFRKVRAPRFEGSTREEQRGPPPGRGRQKRSRPPPPPGNQPLDPRTGAAGHPRRGTVTAAGRDPYFRRPGRPERGPGPQQGSPRPTRAPRARSCCGGSAGAGLGRNPRPAGLTPKFARLPDADLRARGAFRLLPGGRGRPPRGKPDRWTRRDRKHSVPQPRRSPRAPHSRGIWPHLSIGPPHPRSHFAGDPREGRGRHATGHAGSFPSSRGAPGGCRVL